MKVSAGVIILNEFDEIFLCKVTGQPQHDIPKGLVDVGEVPLIAAIRETKEETSIVLKPEQLKDLGVFKYIKNKNIHLFLTYVKKTDINLESLVCTSFFEDRYTKQMKPEVEGFKWVSVSQFSEYTTTNMKKVLTDVLESELTPSRKNKPC